MPSCYAPILPESDCFENRLKGSSGTAGLDALGERRGCEPLVDSGLAEGEIVYAGESGILLSSQYWDYPPVERFIVRDSIRTVLY